MGFLHPLFLLDPLSLFFLFVIAVISLPVCVYSLGYLQGTPSRKTLLFWALLAAFIASMAFVVTVSNAFFFLVAWEIMSLVSFFLVVFDSEHEKSVKAGIIYAVMTHIGTAFLVAAFLIFYRYAGSFDFQDFRQAGLLMPSSDRNAVFLLLLAGFGTKAGIVPLHVWLPYAHPQAPSPISSLMSGVMIKTAVYGLIRFVIFILGAQVSWWGGLVVVLAGISCLVGVLYALMEHDIKRLLAFCSVENIGIILMGVGLSMFFFSLQMPFLAVFALLAGLYHLVNHAIFKGLLFMAAGSVYKATGTRDMEKLGGLIKKMPQTAAYFLVGAMAISALPPLCGFVSEWLTLQAFVMGSIQLRGGAGLFLGICAAAFALAGSLAAACFVKAFGVTFLALPRSRHAECAGEVPLSMRMGMGFLAFLTVAFGLASGFIVKVLSGVSSQALRVDISGMRFSLNAVTLAPSLARGVSLSVPFLAGTLSVLGLGAWALLRLKAKRPVRYRTWDCGYYKLDSRNEYTAKAFSKPFRVAFSFFLRPYRRTQKIRESFYHVTSFAYETQTTPVFNKYFYQPLLGLVLRSAKFMRRMQPGSIHLYLGYIFVTVLVLILFLKAF
ncbi:MAG: proton-conducting transporter membrane subunit [Candidatus Omnitrophota bacterium]